VAEMIGGKVMTGDFYATLAQVLPLLLLAFIWDSGFLERLRRQQRKPKKTDVAGVWFWTKPRVRAYTLLVSTIVSTSIALTVFVLGGVIPDSHGLRIALCVGLVLVLLTLLTRITVDVLGATAQPTLPAGAHTGEQVGTAATEPLLSALTEGAPRGHSPETGTESGAYDGAP
jgi:hypothetical protein